MKKILLFICMVMGVVGAKATYTKKINYVYSTSSINYNLMNYEILGNVSGKSISMMEITSISEDGVNQTLYTSNNTTNHWRFVRIGSDASNYPLWIYFHDTRSSTSGNNGSSDNSWETTNYKYGFYIGYKRNIAKTYVIKGYILVSGGSQTNFEITICPSNAPFFITGNYTTASKTEETIACTTANSGTTVYLANTTNVAPSIIVSGKTFSGSTISSGYYVTTPSLSGNNEYYYYSTTFKATTPGTYTIKATSSSWSSYSTTYTITVSRQTNPLAFSVPSFDAKQGKGIYNLSDAISTNPSAGAITYSCSDANVTISNGKISVTKPGAYTITATQAQTDIYAAGTKTFTITASASKLKKVHSCVFNDYQMSVWYDGATANGWTKNSRNLRYVNSGSMLSSEEFIRGGVEALSGNHTVVKFSNSVSSNIESTRMLLDADNKVVSTNPTFSDTDKYDYVVPGNNVPNGSSSPAKSKGPRKVTAVPDGTQKVTFTRMEGLPSGTHYGTICLPFSVPAGYMPDGFTFEEHTNESDYVDGGMLFLKFTPVDKLEAGVPYIFKRTDASKEELKFEVPVSATTFVAQPSYSDPHFIGSFINLITKDLHCETANNPYNNGDESASIGELDTYFNKIKDSGRMAYFIKPAGETDHIKRATNNVSVRPFRAFFRLNDSDFTTPNQSSAKSIDTVYLEHEGDWSGVTEITPINLSSLQLDVYDVHGRKVASDVDEEDPTDGLQPGIYLLSNGKKVLKK